MGKRLGPRAVVESLGGRLAWCSVALEFHGVQDTVTVHPRRSTIFPWDVGTCRPMIINGSPRMSGSCSIRSSSVFSNGTPTGLSRAGWPSHATVLVPSAWLAVFPSLYGADYEPDPVGGVNLRFG